MTSLNIPFSQVPRSIEALRSAGLEDLARALETEMVAEALSPPDHRDRFILTGFNITRVSYLEYPEVEVSVTVMSDPSLLHRRVGQQFFADWG